jgi:hypothetical protein
MGFAELCFDTPVMSDLSDDKRQSVGKSEIGIPKETRPILVGLGLVRSRQ